MALASLTACVQRAIGRLDIGHNAAHTEQNANSKKQSKRHLDSYVRAGSGELGAKQAKKCCAHSLFVRFGFFRTLAVAAISLRRATSVFSGLYNVKVTFLQRSSCLVQLTARWSGACCAR